MISPFGIKIGGGSTPTPAPVGATLMKTGQTTSYSAKDDGQIERGRLSTFFSLENNNPFGNTKRFTSKVGTDIYTDSVVIDWSTYNGTTVLAYYHGDLNTRPLDNQLTQHVNSTFDGLTGWILVNFNEMVNILNFELMGNFQLNYEPFNRSIRYYWISTQPSGTGGCCTDLAGIAPFISVNKSSSYYGIWARECTVNGTTIT